MFRKHASNVIQIQYCCSQHTERIESLFRGGGGRRKNKEMNGSINLIVFAPFLLCSFLPISLFLSFYIPSFGAVGAATVSQGQILSSYSPTFALRCTLPGLQGKTMCQQVLQTSYSTDKTGRPYRNYARDFKLHSSLRSVVSRWDYHDFMSIGVPQRQIRICSPPPSPQSSPPPSLQPQPHPQQQQQ